jgi:hypothetical protein
MTHVWAGAAERLGFTSAAGVLLWGIITSNSQKGSGILAATLVVL